MKQKQYFSTGGVYVDNYTPVEHPGHGRVMSSNPAFDERGYLLIPKLITGIEFLKQDPPKERGLYNYDRKRPDKFTHSPEEGQVTGSLARYNVPCFRELHDGIKPIIETVLGMELYPTYFYDRFYFVGQQLKRHRDRPACEVSVTLQISSNRPKDDPWPIWFQKPNGEEVAALLADGDAVIYKGCENDHWRDPLPSKYNKIERGWRKVNRLKDDTYHHQVFLHYVDANGPNSHRAYDTCK